MELQALQREWGSISGLWSRRRFLQAVGAAGASTFFARGTARAQAPEVTLLTWSHFVPTYNPELQKLVAEWAGSRKVNARVDFLSLPDLMPKLAGEAEAKRGHDIILGYNFVPALYKENLLDLDDVAEDLGKRYGPWSEIGKYLCNLDGHWKAVPWYHQSLIANINVDYWKAIGMSVEDVQKLNWDGLFQKAKDLQKSGHPVALVTAETFDGFGSLCPVLWSMGGKAVDPKGNVVIKSNETKAALEYVKELFPFMTRDMLGWDDSGNNKYMLSGVGSWTPNPPSIWLVSRLQKLPIADKFDHVPMPSGPQGAYRVGDSNSLAIWKFSRNIDLAKDLIKFLMDKPNYDRQIAAAGGYNQSSLRQFQSNPIWKTERQLRYYEPPVEEIRAPMWPAPPNAGSQIAYNLLIVPLMFVKVVTNEMSIPDAMTWAEKQLQRIYALYRT
jgi:multiple sugar transport system substrate-binding protein